MFGKCFEIFGWKSLYNHIQHLAFHSTVQTLRNPQNTPVRQNYLSIQLLSSLYWIVRQKDQDLILLLFKQMGVLLLTSAGAGRSFCDTSSFEFSLGCQSTRNLMESPSSLCYRVWCFLVMLCCMTHFQSSLLFCFGYLLYYFILLVFSVFSSPSIFLMLHVALGDVSSMNSSVSPLQSSFMDLSSTALSPIFNNFVFLLVMLLQTQLLSTAMLLLHS